VSAVAAVYQGVLKVRVAGEPERGISSMRLPLRRRRATERPLASEAVKVMGSWPLTGVTAPEVETESVGLTDSAGLTSGLKYGLLESARAIP
jgi:hypothetical protein